uniref:Heat shock 70 kDa protein 13 n=1 Tax=Urechis unicinctus TaxID=6432 RepID=A0AAU0MUY4_UREUN
MASGTFTIFGLSFLALLLAGYWAQQLLPPPKPKIVGIDLGTTYSCIGIYHAVSGDTEILRNEGGQQCIPSVVAFKEGKILVGQAAVDQAEHNPHNTIYDAKRFIGKHFSREEFEDEKARYPFKLSLNHDGLVEFLVGHPDNITRVTPEFIGSRVLTSLAHTAQNSLNNVVKKAVMSVPAEFNEEKRNSTKNAAKLAGIEVLRVISEPTAAAMAYGLHKKVGVRNVMVVDLGGGTLDVSLLLVQGGMFLTQAMAGNNHLGGQDFNQRLMAYLEEEIFEEFGKPLVESHDRQALRLITENIKLNLTKHEKATVSLKLHLSPHPVNHMQPVLFTHVVTREMFVKLNADLLLKVLEPIKHVLEDTEQSPDDIDEVVLVGGSTRMPEVRKLIRNFFQKDPNISIDPELAVVSGVSIQAGILGGAWPLLVSAVELPSSANKAHLH